MSGAEILDDIRVHRQRQKAARGIQTVVADDQRTIVQRSFIEKDVFNEEIDRIRVDDGTGQDEIPQSCAFSNTMSAPVFDSLMSITAEVTSSIICSVSWLFFASPMPRNPLMD